MNPNVLQDYTLITTFLNTLNLVGNIFWTLKLKSIQGNKEIVSDLREQNQAKDEIIKSLKEEKRIMRSQYNQLNADHQKMVGELKTYKQFHNHPIVQ